MPRRRVIGLLILIVLLGLAVGALTTGVYGQRVSRREHNERLQAACRDADALRGARLLDEAVAAYGAIERVEPKWKCRGIAMAIGPGRMCPEKLEVPIVCDESRRAAGRRTVRVLKVGAWQDEVRADRQISRQQLEQASQYQRAYLSGTGPAVLFDRALSGYRTGLYLDPGATDARRELQQLLRKSPVAAANVLCKRAGKLFDAGLVPEARIVYAQAFHSGTTTVCKLNGLLKQRWTSSWARGEFKHAAALHRAGNDELARRAYVRAFAADSSLPGTTGALAALPGPDPADARSWSGMLNDASAGWGGVESVTEFVQGKPETLAAAAAVLGVLFLFACKGLQWLARIRLLRPWMDEIPLLRWFTRTQIRVEPFVAESARNGDAEHAAKMQHIAEMTTGFFQHAVRQPPLTRKADADVDRGSLDVIPAVTSTPQVARTGDVLPPLQSLQGVQAVLSWLINQIPREELTITGQLQAAGDRGRGLTLHVFTRRGRPIAWRDFWHDDIRSGGADDAEHDYRELTRYAAAWVVQKALRPRSRGDWRPTGWFQAGVACQEAGRYQEAVELYTMVLDDARVSRNAALQHNLAVCRIRTGDQDGALQALDIVDQEIKQVWRPKPRVKRPYSAGYNRALALQYQAMANPANAAAKYAQALEVSHAVLQALMASDDDAQHLAPAAMLLHAGLLLSNADPLEPGRDRQGASTPSAIVDAAKAIVRNTRPHHCSKMLLAAVGRAEEIVGCVRMQFGSDTRVRYNLACFEARLAARYPPKSDALCKRAKADLAAALLDQRLKSWAPHDPALDVPTLRHDEEWQQLRSGEDREPAPVAKRPARLKAQLPRTPRQPLGRS